MQAGLYRVGCQNVKVKRDVNDKGTNKLKEVSQKGKIKLQEEKEKKEPRRQNDIGENWTQAVRTDVNKGEEGK